MDTPCILHTGKPSAGGYGRIGQKYAHRVAWEEANGPIPDGLCVLHKCDVRMCKNPEHLFLGDRDANNKDRMQKGRSRPRIGENNGRCVLTNRQVLDIREDPRSHRDIAADYGVGKTQIGRIKRREQRGYL